MKNKLLPIALIASAMLLSGCDLSSYLGKANSNSSTSSSENSDSTSEGSSNTGTGGWHPTGGTGGTGNTGGTNTSQNNDEPVYPEEVFDNAGKGSGWTSNSGNAVTSPKAKADYTILIYLCGSNLESYDSQYQEWGSMASKNLLEMMDVGTPDNVNIVIETGGAKSNSRKSGWNNTLLSSYQSGLSISDSKLGRWHIENNILVKDSEITYASMGSKSTFQSFIEYGLEYFPAEKTGVIMWDHGGAMMGCCQDEIKNDILDPFELDSALADAFSAKSVSKLEWIGYDCCLMDVSDIASLNSKYFNYMVAAQESEPGGGWDYNCWLDNLVADTNISTESLLSEICDTFVTKSGDYYNDVAEYYIAYGEYIGGYQGSQYIQEGQEYLGYNDSTLAVLDLSKMSAFDSAWETIGSTMKSKINSSDKFSTFQSNVLEQSLRFGGDQDYFGDYAYEYDVFNASDVIKGLKNKYSIDTTSISSLLDQVVVHNAYGSSYTNSTGLPCGLCFYIASETSASSMGVSASDAVYSNWYDIYSQYGGSSSGYYY